jgi:hypothetical protein
MTSHVGQQTGERVMRAFSPGSLLEALKVEFQAILDRMEADSIPIAN